MSVGHDVPNVLCRRGRDLGGFFLGKAARAYRAIEGKRMPEAFMMVIEKKYNAARHERKRA
jgi:hypothetical protein